MSAQHWTPAVELFPGHPDTARPGAWFQGRALFSIVEHVDSTVIMGRPIDLSRGRKKLSKRSTTNHNSRWLPSKNSRWTIDYD